MRPARDAISTQLFSLTSNTFHGIALPHFDEMVVGVGRVTSASIRVSGWESMEKWIEPKDPELDSRVVWYLEDQA
jgi:hypothetical protein